MTIYDVSLPISESLTVWPDDPPVEISQLSQIEAGDTSTVSRLSLSAHTGTHVDAPKHFLRGGAGVDVLDLEVLVGSALVVAAPDVEELSADVLERLAIPPGVERVLFRTRNSIHWTDSGHEFVEDYVAITQDGARWLVQHGVGLVGVDYLSVAPFDATAPTHKILLEAGVILIEGLNLSGIPAGIYQFVCLPLRITDGDGAPARAILIDS